MKSFLYSTFVLLIIFLSTHVVVQAQPATTGCHITHSQVKAPPLTENQKRALRASIERSDTFDVLHYDMEIKVFDFDRRIIHGQCAVTFSTRMDNISNFSLDLLDLTIDSITMDGASLPFNRTGFVVHMDLPEAMQMGDSSTVTVYYHGNPTVSTSSFGGFYFEANYAYNLGIDLVGNPHNFGRSWFPCFDNFVERATYKIALVSSQGRKGYAVGNFLGEEVIAGDTIRRTYHMQKQLPTYLVGVGISNYAEENYVHSGAFGDIPVQLVAKPADMNNAINSLAFLPDAIDCLEYWYGPYVWNRVGYIMATRGAMEHAGNIAYPENSIANGALSTRLMTHELCHHWWGNLVTVNYAPDMWIKEGNAEYGAHLIEEFIGGDVPFRTAVRNNHHFVITTAHLEDGDYIALSPLSQENTYGRHTYYRGASMLHNLRAYLGDTLFRNGQTTVLNENAYSYLNAQAYRDALTLATGVDMTSFFDDWIFSPGYSDYYLHHSTYAEDIDELTLHIGQNQYHSDHLHTNAPVPVTLYFEDGTQMDVRAMTSGALDSFTVSSVINEPVAISINRGNRMNLAMFEDVITADAPGEYKDARANYKITIDNLIDTFTLAIENHLTAPEGIYDASLYRLSNNHFWHIAGTQEEKYEGNFFLYYDDTDELAPDGDLTGMSEDSIVVMYRPDATQPWVEYPDYIQIKLIPTDGRGTMVLSNLLSGDYTFANRLDGMVATRNTTKEVPIAVYPNPTSDLLTVDLKDIRLDRMDIYSIDGRLMTSIEQPESRVNINVTSYPEGEYFLLGTGKDVNEEVYGVQSFVVSK